MLHSTGFTATELWFTFSNNTILACNALEQTLFCIFLRCIFFKKICRTKYQKNVEASHNKGLKTDPNSIHFEIEEEKYGPQLQLHISRIFSYLDFLKDLMLSGAGFLSLERSTNSNLPMKQCLIITALSTFPPFWGYFSLFIFNICYIALYNSFNMTDCIETG
jgi:hypothetical protein